MSTMNLSALLNPIRTGRLELLPAEPPWFSCTPLPHETGSSAPPLDASFLFLAVPSFKALFDGGVRWGRPRRFCQRGCFPNPVGCWETLTGGGGWSALSSSAAGSLCPSGRFTCVSGRALIFPAFPLHSISICSSLSAGWSRFPGLG